MGQNEIVLDIYKSYKFILMNQNQNIFAVFFSLENHQKERLCACFQAGHLNMPKRALRPKELEKRFHQGCADKRREGRPSEYRAFILGHFI